MNQFTSKFAPHIVAVLSGFDRVVLTGMIRHLCGPKGMDMYLRDTGVLIKNFGQHAIELSEQVKKASLAHLEAQGAPYHYLTSPNASKEEFARRIAKQNNISEGHVCAIGCVESCKSFDVQRNPDTGHIGIVGKERRCLHLYSYRYHPLLEALPKSRRWSPEAISLAFRQT